MSSVVAFEFPPEQAAARRKAKRLAWLSITLLFIAGAFVFLTTGQSEAMKTAWITDILSAVPPIASLVALRFELRRPNQRFPYGYFRSPAIAFLVTATVLLLMGLELLYDSAMKLVKQQRPPIGTMVLFGHQMWAGWPMIASLAFSLIVGLTIGKLKGPVAKTLNDRQIEAEAKMNRDEWMSEGAAIIGILLVFYGRWWGDALAALLISLDIVYDGWYNLRLVVADLMDETPNKMGSRELEELPTKLARAAEGLPWVAQAAARLREQGHTLTGEVFVVPRDGTLTLEQLERATDELRTVDWRLHDLGVRPVASLDSVHFMAGANGGRADGR